MIYLEKQNVSIITPPHTASGNLHRALCSNYGGQWIEGLTPFDKEDDPKNHHYAAPIEGSKVYYVCRNPLTRLVGLFLHYEWSQKEEPELLLPYLCWEEYVLKLGELHWFSSMTLSEFIDGVNVKDYELIRYENIVEDVSKAVGESVVLAPAYHAPIKLQEWYDYEQDWCGILKAVREWGEEDAERFGYDITSQLW